MSAAISDELYPLFCDASTADARSRDSRPIFGATPEGRAKLKAASRNDLVAFARQFGTPGAFAMFLAWPRSGHSLLAALLDAHPEICLAHELHAFAYFFERFRPEEVYYYCWQNARHYGKFGRKWGDYDYRVPGQWQGQVRALRVVGDKKGGESSLILSQYPENLARLRKRLGKVPLKIVHAVRHPMDTVATMSGRWKHEDYSSVEDAIDRYRRCAAANARALQEMGGDAITVWHEDLIADPRAELARLAQFFAVEPDAAWLDACARVVRPSASLSRKRVDWTAEQVDHIRSVIGEFNFLQRYGVNG